MMDSYKCGTCGVVSDQKEQMCEPVETKMEEYCGSGPEHISQVCEEMDQRMDHQCSTCGRPTDNPEMVCDPWRIR